MHKILTAILFATLFAACGDPSTPADPCETVDCGLHGTCDTATGICKCSAGYFGDKCDKHFDPTQFKTSKVFCPSDSGRMEIAGETGAYAKYNGYFVDVPADAFDQCVWFVISFADGKNLPDPKSGKIVPWMHGLEIGAVSKIQPYLPNGKLNYVQPLRKIKPFFNDHRAEVLNFDEDSKTFSEVIATLVTVTVNDQVRRGMLAEVSHFSTFYLNNHDPVIAASAVHIGNREVIIDFNGTTDEGSVLPHLLKFSAEGDGTPLTLINEGSDGLKFKATLAGGQHTLTVTVKDPYGNSDSMQVQVEVDLCTGVTCQSWETCRELDGECVGTDPCLPNPCQNGGSCDNITGSAVCTCVPPYGGATCTQQDLCYQKTCSGHGTCQPSTGNCQCNTGFAGSDCSSCDTGFVNYPTCQDDACDPNPCLNGGTCSLDSSFSAVCSCATGYTGSTCNTCAAGYVGYPTCVADPCYGVSCSGHGTCSGGTCSCDTGYAGANCDSCAAGYTGYPTCVADPCYGVSCSGHGTCSGGTCTCNTGYTGTSCDSCSAGYYGYPNCTADPCYGISCNGHGTCSGGTCSCNTGYDPATNCGSCLPTYEGYPTCVPDVTPPADPVITTNGGVNFDTHQDSFTIQGTCASDTYTMWVKIDGGASSQLTGYTAGATIWTYNGNNPTIFTGHDYCFFAKDQANNASGEDCIHVDRVP